MSIVPMLINHCSPTLASLKCGSLFSVTPEDMAHTRREAQALSDALAPKGLAIRVIGEITEEKLSILREADAIFREEMRLAGLDRTTSQFFAVLTNLRSVGVMGDERTYDYTLALRAVQSQDFMTATWSRLPYELLDKVSGRIVGEVKHINRICYDITSKPPATVEWE